MILLTYKERRAAMKRKSIRQAVVLLILGTVLLLGPAPAVSAGADEAAIDKIRAAFNAAYNAGDAKAMGALIDRNAVWMPPTGEKAIIGADKVVHRYTAFFEKTRSAFELQPGMIQVSGRWAFLNGPWHRADAEKKTGKSMKHGGYYLMVFKKQTDGSWKIFRDIWNDVGQAGLAPGSAK